jgi:hypothetical protein
MKHKEGQKNMSVTLTKPPVLDSTGKEIASAILGVVGALGGDASGAIKHFSEMRQLTRLGLLSKYVKVGDLIAVSKESGISATVTGGVTAATVTEDAFLAKAGTAETHAYEFLYDGAAWHIEGEPVELTDWGISITGTPAEGDAVVVHVQAGIVYFEAADHDYDVPADADREHSFSMISRDILSYGTIPFSSPQALKAIAADEFPSGLAAGTYNITLNHGAYDNSTSQDGTYQFTTTQPVPVGGKIKHSTIGKYQSSSYTKAQILAGTFTTYDASYNVIESGLVTTEGNDGTSLGTATAETKSYMSGTHLNSTRRQGQGSNRGLHSAMRKWLRSSAAGAGSGQIASWWTASNEFDMPVKTTLPGFLHGMDPEFVACIGPVRKRTCLHAWDRTDSTAYEDTVETVFQVSMTELGYGNNDGVAECSPKTDGTINKSGAYALYVGATNADRIKRQNGTAKYYFHRSPLPSRADRVRDSGTDGSLHNDYASYTNGVVAGLCFT